MTFSRIRRPLSLIAAAGVLSGAGAVAVLAGSADATTPKQGPNQAVKADPEVVHPAGKTTVSGTCGYSTSGMVMSNAFITDPSEQFAGEPAKFFQTAPDGAFLVFVDINPAAKPGSYPISVRCGGGTLGVTAPLTVIAATANPSVTTNPTVTTNPDTVKAQPHFTG